MKVLKDLRMLQQIVSAMETDLTGLQQAVTQSNPNPRTIQQLFLKTQQRFQSQLLPTASADGGQQVQIQPILTEMNRTLRLLGMDVAFLQAARQSTKVQQRQKQMCDRITQLQNFCIGLQRQLENAEA